MSARTSCIYFVHAADELDKVDDSSDGAGTSADAEAAGESDWAV